jgi:glycosyltransferase involved in cell wall biosynthesis
MWMNAVADKSKLRVAHVVLQLDKGGMEKLLVEFARHADRDRFDLRFVSLSGRGTVAEEIEACGWPVLAMEEPAGLRPGMVLRLAKLFKQWDVDVVHAHNTKPLFYAAPAGRWSRVPGIIYTCHGQRYGASRAETMVFRTISHLVDRVVCVSNESAACRVREGIAASKVSTIWNGIDLSQFSYQPPQRNGPAVLVARLRPEKDVETLLHATTRVIEQAPDFRLEIAGDGARLEALKQLSSELKLQEHVQFLGEVKDVAGLLGRASMLVMSSLGEGLSVSVMEAMSRGLPVVATRVGGNPEIIVDQETGLLVEKSDPVALSGAILRIWRDPELVRQMGAAGRKRVEAFFNIRRMVADYERMYEDVCARARLAVAHEMN